MRNNPPKIFISYSHNDRPHAKRLASELKSVGAEVYVDYKATKPGDSFPRRIEKALEWCDTLILLWTKAAQESHWVEKEWHYALNKQKRVIPCLVDGTELSPLLSTTLYFDFREIGAGMSQLLSALAVTPEEYAPFKASKAGSFNKKSSRTVGEKIAIWMGIAAAVVAIITGIVKLKESISPTIPESAIFLGKLVDQNNQGVEAATVYTLRTLHGDTLGFGESDARGEFNFIVQSKPENSVYILIEKDGVTHQHGFEVLSGNKRLTLSEISVRAEKN